MRAERRGHGSGGDSTWQAAVAARCTEEAAQPTQAAGPSARSAAGAQLGCRAARATSPVLSGITTGAAGATVAQGKSARAADPADPAAAVVASARGGFDHGGTGPTTGGGMVGDGRVEHRGTDAGRRPCCGHCHPSTDHRYGWDSWEPPPRSVAGPGLWSGRAGLDQSGPS